MTTEENEPGSEVDPTETIAQHPVNVVPGPPAAFVEESTRTTFIKRRDAYATAQAASGLIQTIIWSGVVITLLVVGILILVRYHIL